MTAPFFFKQINSVEELKAVQQLEQIVWGTDITPIHQSLTVVKNGGIVIGAYDGAKIVGFSYGFPGFKDRQVYFCSHMLAIRPDYRGKGLGEKIKGMQQDIAVDMGYSLITWTFDPLENINAYLNLHKLSGIATHYVENNYGSMNDTLNSGLSTDRFLVEWWITSDHVNNQQPWLSEIIFDENRVLLRTEVNKLGLPTIISSDSSHNLKIQESENEIWFMPIPINFQQIKKVDIKLAIDWRIKTRSMFQKLIANGYVAINVLRDPDQNVHYYVFVKKEILAI